jgi:hypothetical protein
LSVSRSCRCAACDVTCRADRPLNPPVAVDGELDPASVLVERVAGQADDVEGIQDRDRVHDFLGGSGLETGEPVLRGGLDAVTPRLVWSESQVLNACFERASTMSGSRAGPVPSRTGVRSTITVTYLSPRRMWRHTWAVRCVGDSHFRDPLTLWSNRRLKNCDSSATQGHSDFTRSANHPAPRWID